MLSKTKLIILAVMLISSSLFAAEQLSLDRQLEVIRNYMHVTGQTALIPSGFALSEKDGEEIKLPEKCGMNAAADLLQNLDRLDKDLLAKMGANISGRPPMNLSYVSGSGYFKIHYDIEGINAVLNAGSMTDGTPNYVRETAVIFDSVYAYIIDSLGYPVPLSDSIVGLDDSLIGGDGLYDVYLYDLGASVYGQTRPTHIVFGGGPDSTIRAVSIIELDNDYAELVEYINRPLDAVRVTAAHEFFHAVQFAIEFSEIDFTEEVRANNTIDTVDRRYWMEMSSVWMEEQMYDDINDYYFYLPFFFNEPFRSIQQFTKFGDLRPYGAGIFPIFLAQKYGPDVIKEIWFKCADTLGPTFLTATEAVLDSITGDSLSWTRHFTEFATWNFFTGPRANLAPEGIGYEEAENYSYYADAEFTVLLPEYRLIRSGFFPRNPEHNGTGYIKFDQLQAFQRDTYWFNSPDSLGFVDTTYWDCNIYVCLEVDTAGCENIIECCVDSVCIDSVRVFETQLGYSWVNIDTSWCIDDCELRDLGGTTYLTTSGGSTTITAYDSVTVDSQLTLFFPLYDFPPTPPGWWGFSLLVQPKDNPSEFIVIDTILFTEPEFGQANFFDILDPDLAKSITVVACPATSDLNFYKPRRPRYDRGSPINFGLFLDEDYVDSLVYSTIDIEALNLSPDILVAYPNPAVVANMGGENLHINYQVPTDNVSDYLYDVVRVTFDVFSLSGERVRSINTKVQMDPVNMYNANSRTVLWDSEWDMKNDAGAEVASGVYLIIARVFSDPLDDLLTEKTVKVAIIR